MDSRPEVAPVATSAPPGTAHVARALARRGLAGTVPRRPPAWPLPRGARELTVLAFHRIGNPGGARGRPRRPRQRRRRGLRSNAELPGRTLHLRIRGAREGGARCTANGCRRTALLLTFDDGYRDFVSACPPGPDRAAHPGADLSDARRARRPPAPALVRPDPRWPSTAASRSMPTRSRERGRPRADPRKSARPTSSSS